VRYWYPVTDNEMYVVLGLFMLTGIIQKPTTRLCFSKRRVLQTPGFNDVITRERFELICSFLHFSDDNHLNSKFQSPYLPEPNIAIDESLNTLEGLFILQAISTTEVIKIWNKDL
jgi:hypothetical protein